MIRLLPVLLLGATLTAETRDELIAYLNSIAARQLAERDRAVAALRTRDDVEGRKRVVREKILRLIGGLPERRGPLNPRSAGALTREGYRVDKVIFESLPGFHVTANVYVPAGGSGPFPAVLIPAGHSDTGKAYRNYATLAMGLALKGILAMTYDPIGQGERYQYWDPARKASTVGGPTAEHSFAGGHLIAIGDNVSRYRIWDGMRAIDYLLTRPDVDRERVGCAGCSGGGTLTAYIAALDERVKVAAPPATSPPGNR